MEILQISGQGWRDFKDCIASGTLHANPLMALGPSEEMTVQVQTVLDNAFQLGYRVNYFLCSGHGIFRLPCFQSWTDKTVTSEPLSATHFLTGGAFSRESVVKQALNEAMEGLAQTTLRNPQPPPLILVEYLTPPAWFDLSFTISLLRSEIAQRASIVIFVHQSSTSNDLLWQPCDMVETILVMLYLCAGRINQAHWQKIRSQLPEKSIDDRLIASRRVGLDKWICYANRSVAKLAERVFQTMEEVRKHEIASSVLQILPCSIDYPLLAIASETDDLTTMLSTYSQATVNIALAEPEGLVRYFDLLQKSAQKARRTAIMHTASLSYLSSRCLLSEEQNTQIYKRRHEIALLDTIGTETQGFFWYTLGQQFVKMKDPQSWDYAADCFRRSRECFQGIEQENRPDVSMGLALIANGEALIAYKRRQYEKARQLEEFALEKSRDLILATNFQVHLRINLGDVLRSLGDLETAIVRYGEALLAISQIRQKFKLQVMPRHLAMRRQQAALKVGSAFMKAEQYHETIRFLEYFLRTSKKGTGTSGFGEESRTLECRMRLALAQAYLKTGQQRKAAASYWHILRHPQWLEPALLREVAEEIGHCRLHLHEHLQKRIERIVSEQVAIIADTVKIREVLSQM